MTDFQTPDDESIPSGDFQTPANEAVQGEGESVLRGALRNIPLAQQAVATAAPILNKVGMSDEPTYGAELQHLTQAAEQGKAQNPWSYYAGATAGTLAPMLVPGGGEVAEALQGSGAVGGAINGAVQSLSDTNLTKPTGTDVTNTLLAAGMGGALGKYFSPKAVAIAGAAENVSAPAEAAAGKVAPAIAQEAAPVVAGESAPSVAAQFAQQSIPTPKMLQSLAGMAVPNREVSPDFVPSADRVYASNLAQGFGGTPRQLMKVFGKKDPVQTMVGIGQWMEHAGPDGTPINKLLDRPGELLDKVTEINNKSGKTIGGIIDDLGKTASVNNQQLLEDLAKFRDTTADPDTAARVARLIKTTEANVKKGIDGFDNLQQIKSMAGEQIRKDPEMASVYGHLADTVTTAVNTYGAQIQNPGIAKIYEKAKGDYFNSSRILPILRYAESKDLVGGPGGHHTLRGLLASIFNMASSVTTGTTPDQIVKNATLKAAPIARDVVNAATNARQSITPAVGAVKNFVGNTAANKVGSIGGSKLSRAAQLELVNALENKFRIGK